MAAKRETPCPILSVSFCGKGGRPLAPIPRIRERAQFDHANTLTVSFPPRRTHLRLHFDKAHLAQRPGAEARPWPIFRRLAQAPLDRIAVNIAKLGNEAGLVAHVVIEVSGLPKGQVTRCPLPLLPRL